MSNPMEKPMDKGKQDAMKALIEKTRAHQAEFIARNPDFRAEQEARIAEATRDAPATTEAALKRLKKKKPRDFQTFIENSLPPRDRE